MSTSSAEQSDAQNTAEFYKNFDKEENARQLAATNPCLVPDMTNELYDCCGSDTIEAICVVFGTINAFVLGAIVISLVILLLKSQWFRTQLLLSFTVSFQILSAIWRTWFYLSAGWKGSSSFTYIMTRSSDSGDFAVSLLGFAMFLY